MKVIIALALLAQVALVLSQRNTRYEYQAPRPSIKLLNPRGFRMSIHDRPGIETVSFHANVNKPLSDRDPGEYSESLSRPTNRRWSLAEYSRQFNHGDQINFRVSVIKDGKEYRYDNGKYFVTAHSFSSEESNESYSSEERYRF